MSNHASLKNSHDQDFISDKRESTDTKDMAQVSDIPSEIDPTQDHESWDRVNLERVVEYYESSFSKNEQVGEYLLSKGIKNFSLWQRFRIGFSDGSLRSKIGEQQTKELKRLGILGKSGKEHLQGCLVFPVENVHGETVQLYGHYISDSINKDTEKNTNNHLCLQVKERGIFNRKASRIYDVIMLAGSVFDGLSLIQLGFENVQSFYGTTGFTQEHLELLQNDRVKTIILALENDDSAHTSASEIVDKLIEEFFQVKTIVPPANVKDWNDYLLQGNAAGKEDLDLKAEIGQFIDSADLKNPSSRNSLSRMHDTDHQHIPNASFHVEKENLGTNFIFDDVNYNVSGLKEIFVSNLRVNIKTTLRNQGSLYQNTKYYDSLDLYSARSRKSFSQNLTNELGLEAKRVERDLIEILEYLENERDKALEGDSRIEKELTEEDKKLGLSFLQSKDIIGQIQNDMDILGYVGEGRNKAIMYLIATSRLLDDPMSVIVMSQSASGKSMLMETVEEMLPEEDVVSISSLSDKALNYYKDLMHKFMTLGEAVYKEEVEYQLREIQSKRELTRLVTAKDPRSGEITSKLVKTEVLVALALTTTSDKINPENASRNFMLQTDESVEQTARIHRQQRRKYSLERVHEKKEAIPLILKKHHAAQRLLKNYLIINPYSDHLRFPENLMRTRRDHDRFLDLIAVVCFLRQYQKEVKEFQDKKYIECDIKDYEISYDLMIHGVLSASVTELPRGAVDLYKVMRDYSKVTAKNKNLFPEDITFTQRDIREYCGFNQTWIKRQFKILADYEYLEIVRGGGPRSRGYYRLRDDEEITRMDNSMILSPDELRNILNNSNL